MWLFSVCIFVVSVATLYLPFSCPVPFTRNLFVLFIRETSPPLYKLVYPANVPAWSNVPRHFKYCLSSTPSVCDKIHVRAGCSSCVGSGSGSRRSGGRRNNPPARRPRSPVCSTGSRHARGFKTQNRNPPVRCLSVVEKCASSGFRVDNEHMVTSMRYGDTCNY